MNTLIFNRRYMRLIHVNLSFDEVNVAKLCLVETVNIEGVEERVRNYKNTYVIFIKISRKELIIKNRIKFTTYL